MKTERRHELQQNALADVLTDWIESIKPYSTAIFGAIIACVVLVGVAAYLSRQASQQQEVAWDEVLISPQSSDTATEEDRRRLVQDRLLSVADQFGDAPAGIYARVMAANGQLNRGIDQLFLDKAAGTDELRDAIKNYTLVLENTTEPVFTQQATLGLARAHESLNELQKAREYYQKLVEQKGLYSQMAEARLKDLDRKSTKDFYDWFAQQQPRPRLNSLPGIPGLGPDFNFDGSSTPSDFNLSDPFTGGKADTSKAGTEPASTVPAATGPAGTGSAPVESETPAASTTPEPPATSPPATTPPATTPPPAAGEKAAQP